MDIEDLEREALSQYSAIEKLQKENKSLKEEITHLKALLTGSSDIVAVPKEQAACEIQLEMLHKKSKERELTLEETKRLEILIKSLYLIKDKATGVSISDPNSLSIEALTKIAHDGE